MNETERKVTIEVPDREVTAFVSCVSMTIRGGLSAAADLEQQQKRSPLPPADFLADFEKRAELGRLASEVTQGRSAETEGVTFTGDRGTLLFLAQEVSFDVCQDIQALTDEPSATGPAQIRKGADRLEWWLDQAERLRGVLVPSAPILTDADLSVTAEVGAFFEGKAEETDNQNLRKAFREAEVKWSEVTRLGHLSLDASGSKVVP